MNVWAVCRLPAASDLWKCLEQLDQIGGRKRLGEEGRSTRR